MIQFDQLDIKSFSTRNYYIHVVNKFSFLFFHFPLSSSWRISAEKYSGDDMLCINMTPIKIATLACIFTLNVNYQLMSSDLIRFLALK